MSNPHSQSMKTLWMLPLVLCSSWTAAQTTVLPPGVERYPGTAKTKPQTLPDISELALERTRCLASCPAYTVTIQADGTFSYTGVYNVTHMGQRTGKVNVGQLKQVFRYIDEIGFTDFKTSYLSPFLDNATVRTSVVQNGTRQTVTNYANSGPATLWALETLIDTLLATATWDVGGGQK